MPVFAVTATEAWLANRNRRTPFIMRFHIPVFSRLSCYKCTRFAIDCQRTIRCYYIMRSTKMQTSSSQQAAHKHNILIFGFFCFVFFFTTELSQINTHSSRLAKWRKLIGLLKQWRTAETHACGMCFWCGTLDKTSQIRTWNTQVRHRKTHPLYVDILWVCFGIFNSFHASDLTWNCKIKLPCLASLQVVMKLVWRAFRWNRGVIF